jgi:hypothetical protein
MKPEAGRTLELERHRMSRNIGEGARYRSLEICEENNGDGKVR